MMSNWEQILTVIQANYVLNPVYYTYIVSKPGYDVNDIVAKSFHAHKSLKLGHSNWSINSNNWSRVKQ